MSAAEATLAMQIQAKKQPRACLQCGIEFVPKTISKRHKGLFCSRVCFTRSRRTIRSCETCNKSFYATNNRRKYCSVVCGCKGNSGPVNHWWRGGKEKRTCPECDAEFYSFPSQVMVCCTPKCAVEWQRKQISHERNGNWRGGKYIRCRNCGKNTWEYPSRNIGYCSKNCFYEHKFSNRKSEMWNAKSPWGYGRAKSGKRQDLGIFVRSSWEANYARYLNFLKDRGEIAGWKYENKTFHFSSIKRGTRYYTPDFEVLNKDQSIEYHEVKGYSYQKGETAIRRMGKYYPNVRLVLIRKKQYDEIRRKVGPMISGWE